MSRAVAILATGALAAWLWHGWETAVVAALTLALLIPIL